MNRIIRLSCIIWILLFSFFLEAESDYQKTSWLPLEFEFEDLESCFYISVEGVDIDFDGDMDLFLGTGNGKIFFYENKGNPREYSFQLKKESPKIKGLTLKEGIYNKGVIRFIDIDGDNDLDLFIGNNEGNIAFYRNDGNIMSPHFVKIKSGKSKGDSYFDINVGLSSAPFFIDIDNDGDYDLFIGNANGYIAFYKNEGSSDSALFVRIFGGFVLEDSFHHIDVGEYSIPVFTDINQDDKYDLFIGNYDGEIFFYKNIGTTKIPGFQLASKSFSKINVEGDASACFIDINNDGKDELLVGNNEGRIFLFKHPSAQKVIAYANEVKQGKKKKKKNDIAGKVSINIDEVLLDKALTLVKDKDYIEAMNILNKIKKKNKNSKKLIQQCKKEIKNLYNKLNKGSFLFKEVESNFKKAVQYYINSKYKKCIKEFNKVLSNIPNQKISLRYKKYALNKMKKNKIQKEAEMFYSSALYQYKKSNLKDAYYFIKKALQINKNNENYLELHTQYSNEYIKKRDQLIYTKGITEAEILIEHKKYNRAIKLLTSLKGSFPDDNKIQSLIKICKSKSKFIKKTFNRKMKIKYLNQADSYFTKNDFNNALKYYKLARQYDRNDMSIKEKIKSAELKIKRKKQRRLDPQAVKKYFQNGIRLYTLGQYEKAIIEWERVLEIDPQHIMAKKNIAKAKQMMNK